MLRRLLGTALLLTTLPATVSAQDARTVVATASRAMGADALRSITYSGTARNGAFGQSKAIENPMGAVNVTRITTYTRTLRFAGATGAQLVSRATGPSQPPDVPGVPPQPVGMFNQNITATQAQGWPQGMNVWMTPWGFLQAAAAAPLAPTARTEGDMRVVSFSPAEFRSPSGLAYTVSGTIDAQNRVTRVETVVDNGYAGDLPVVFEYSGYRTLNGVQVPARIVQRQAGMIVFEADVTAATPNPANLAELLPAPAAPAGQGGGGAAPAGAPEIERLGDGVFRIGGNYTSLAVDMGDHILVVESGQNDTRGLAVMAAAKQAIPNKPIRFVVNSHPHSDHAGGLGAAVAEGATILTHRNNEALLERFLAAPRALTGDALSKVARRRTDVVQAVGDVDVRTGANGKVVALHHIPNEHTDGMLAVYLPAEKVLWTADVNVVNPNPGQLGVLKSVVQEIDRAQLDYDRWIQAHPPTPDRPLTKADVQTGLGAQ